MERFSNLDVAIVGGGPVGLATAIHAANAGLRVAVFDQREPPIDKACGEGLMPEGVEQLAELGVYPEDLEPSRAFRGIRYLDDDTDTEAEARFPSGRGLGIRRPVLHAALARRAEQSGAALAWGARVAGLADGGLLADGSTVQARWVVGADGLASKVRAWTGLAGRPVRSVRRRRFGVRRHFAVRPWTDLVEVYWSRGCEAYVTPVADDEVGVALLWTGGDSAGPSFKSLLGRFPRLSERLRSAGVSSTDRGAGPLLRRVRGPRRGRVLLVGDAAGYVDAITGEGLTLGFLQARALAGSLAEGRPEHYGRALRRISRRPLLLVRSLLFAERRPWLRRRFIRSLAADPQLFQRLLAVHGGELALSGFGVGGAARLFRGMLRTAKAARLA